MNAASAAVNVPMPPHSGVLAPIAHRENVHRALRQHFDAALARWLNQRQVSALLDLRTWCSGFFYLCAGTPNEPVWFAAIAYLDALVLEQAPADESATVRLRALEQLSRDGPHAPAAMALWRSLAAALTALTPRTRAQRLAHAYWHLYAWADRQTALAAPAPHALPVAALLGLAATLPPLLAAAHATAEHGSSHDIAKHLQALLANVDFDGMRGIAQHEDERLKALLTAIDFGAPAQNAATPTVF